MRLFTPWLVSKWQGRMLNIHPALLPAFKGLHTHEQAIGAGVKIHGATVHLVSAEMDSGPIVCQGAAPVHDDDTAETLGRRVLAIEHRIYPLALQWLAEGSLRVSSGRCAVAGVAHVPEGVMIVPSAGARS
jgi:phosphoribosylglycinamide formyltransferase-1